MYIYQSQTNILFVNCGKKIFHHKSFKKLYANSLTENPLVNFIFEDGTRRKRHSEILVNFVNTAWTVNCVISRSFCSFVSKVEKILTGSLDSNPSPSSSVKIQIMVGKVCLRCKGKTLMGVVNKLLKTESLLTSPTNVLPLHLK